MDRSYYPAFQDLWKTDGNAEEFLREKLSGETDAIYRERLDQEFDAIIQNQCAIDLAALYMIHVAASSVGHLAAGSGILSGLLVSNRLGLSYIDPVEYGLDFKAFLQPETGLNPLFTLLGSPEGRERIISFLKLRLGANRVAVDGDLLYLANKSIRDIAPCDWGKDRTLTLEEPLPPFDDSGMLVIDLIASDLIAELEKIAGSIDIKEMKVLFKYLRTIPLDDRATLNYLKSADGKKFLEKYVSPADRSNFLPLPLLANFVKPGSESDIGNAIAFAYLVWCLAFFNAHY